MRTMEYRYAGAVSRSILPCLLALTLTQVFATFPNRVKDAEDGLFGQAGPLSATGLPTWTVSEPYINLWIYDQPLTYTTSYGQPIGFGVAFKQRDNRSNSKIFSLGPSWESSWLTYVEYTTTGGTVTAGTNYVKLGGARLYTADGTTKEFKSASTMAKLTDGGGAFTAFQISYPSGAKETYGYLFQVSTSENYAFLSEQIDPAGRTNRFVYDTISNVVRLRQMIDWDSRTNTVRYHATYDKQINEVEDHYGRKASFGYDGNGRLNSITNAGGLVASFQYDGWNWITDLTTVYGTTAFGVTVDMEGPETLGGNNKVNRCVRVTEPDGTKQMFLYRDQSTKLNSGSGTDLIPASYSSGEVPNTSVPNPPALANTFNNSYQDARNSFYWNTKQYDSLSSAFKSSGNFNDLTLSDYMIARRHHWLRRYNNDDVVTDTLSLRQAASPDGTNWGQKVWFDYAGKVSGQNWTRGTNATPRFEALVLPDGSTRYTYAERNVWEKPTRIVDTYTSGSSVAARTNNFVFASNNLDLTEWRAPSNELLSSNLYNGFHQVVAHFNAVNDRTDFTYDSAHRLTGIDAPGGLVTTNVYHTSGNHIGWLLHTIDYDKASGNPFRATSFGAYSKGLPTSTTNVYGLTITSAWDDLQRLSTITVPAGTYTYQYNKLELEKVIDPLSSTNRFTFDAMQRLTAVIDAQSTNAFKYTGGLVSDSTNALQQVEKYDHDLNGHLLKVTYPDTAFMNLRFSLLGHLTNRTDVVGSVQSYFYNNQGLLAASSNAFGQALLRKYDLRDRLTNQVDSRGVSVTITYDNLGRMLTRAYPDGGAEKFEYSPRGLITYTNQLGFVTRFGYDALGRRLAVTNANNEVVRYTYDAGGNALSLTDGKNQAVSFGYDLYGRLTSKTNAAGAEILRFQYDAAGRTTNRWTLGKGNTGYAYDDVSNLANINYAASTDVTFGYDALKRLKSMKDAYSALVGATNQTSWTYNTAGVLQSENGLLGNALVSYEYWTNDVRKLFFVQQKDGSYWTNGYSYDPALRLKVIDTPAGLFTNFFSPGVFAGTTCGSPLVEKTILPNAAYITNAYDSVARLAFTKLMSSTNVALNSHTYLYNQGNQRTKHTRLDNSYTDYTYDNIGQLRTALGKESGGANRLNEQFRYGYDAAWSLLAKTNNALVLTNELNSRNHLTTLTRSGSSTFTVAGNTTVAATSVTVNGNEASKYGDYTYAKDVGTINNGTNTFTVIAQDSSGRKDTNVLTANLPSSVTFTYDQNGNLTSDGLRGFDYDDENRLTRITLTNNWKTEFIYDGLGRRRVRNEYLWFNGAWAWNLQIEYIYDGNVVVQERWGGDEPWVNYTRGLDLSGSWQGAGGIGGLLARSQKVSGAYQNHYYHSDGNGNVTALINSSQVISARYFYDPYGNLLASSGGMADANVYRFSSQEFHEKSGLYAYAMRFYEPRLGRWLNGDPLREGGGINLYQFCGGDPINRIDPWGLGLQISAITMEPDGTTSV
ncbi:MAG: RHS repeat-associated core domain-containing protein, partial [Verrucomicrobia bacterium]|nr:RHS repeat-associated core domain-containing protein [Verrucomicrobiota bacterium]